MPFIVRRVIFYLVAAWVALTINFFIPRAMPGNAVESVMSKFPNLQPSAYKALQAMLGVEDVVTQVVACRSPAA